MRAIAPGCLTLLLLLACPLRTSCAAAGFQLHEDMAAGSLHVTLGGQEAFVYQYGGSWDLPHFCPLNSPSGKNLLVEKTNPYPHHRAFWFADTVRREGTTASLYNSYYSGVKKHGNVHEPPYDTSIRHVAFLRNDSGGTTAAVEEDLVWETHRTSSPYRLLDEHRTMKLYAMRDGGYLMDITFTLAATCGDVTFLSDPVHYAWPYLRMSPAFSGEHGGTLTADNGTTGQAATNMKPARWIDYSNTVDGVTEGLALFQWPDGETHRWLTREYGTFGPRRPDRQSGIPFTLKKGESISQRVGVLVHKGDVSTGRVAQAYEQYVKGAFP